MTGGSQGAAIALTTELNNRQLHPRELDAINKYAKDFVKYINSRNGCAKDKSKCIKEDEAKTILGWAALDRIDEEWHNALNEATNGKNGKWELGRVGELYSRYRKAGLDWLDERAARDKTWRITETGQRYFSVIGNQYKDYKLFLDSVAYESERFASRPDHWTVRDAVTPLLTGTLTQSFYDKHLRLDQDGKTSAVAAVKDIAGESWESIQTVLNDPKLLATLPAAVKNGIKAAYVAMNNCNSDKAACAKAAYLDYIQQTRQDRTTTQVEVLLSAIPVERAASGLLKTVRFAAGSAKATSVATRAANLTVADRVAVEKAIAHYGPKLPEGKLIADAEKAGMPVAKYVSSCLRVNSFDPFTSVWTLGGLQPIGSLKVGTLVLAFNEATGQNGYYPITAVHRNLDPELTFLWVKTNGTGAKELIETTPEHPFYLAGNVDGSARPDPQGHDDLSERWVGAGHLKEGDRLKLADGSLGTVLNVTTVQQTREMFNLTVETAHTFYVGTNGWLVHNQSSTALRASMVNAGSVPPWTQLASTNWRAHHLTPVKEFNNPFVVAARRAGYNIDGASNGLAMPFETVDSARFGVSPSHRGSHPQYRNWYGQQLADLEARRVAEGWSDKQAKTALEDLQRRAANLIKSGAFDPCGGFLR